MDRAMSMDKLYLFNTFFLPRLVCYYLIISLLNGYIFSVAMALNETLKNQRRPYRSKPEKDTYKNRVKLSAKP
jgi:hypothetical protein